MSQTTKWGRIRDTKEFKVKTLNSMIGARDACLPLIEIGNAHLLNLEWVLSNIYLLPGDAWNTSRKNKDLSYCFLKVLTSLKYWCYRSCYCFKGLWIIKVYKKLFRKPITHWTCLAHTLKKNPTFQVEIVSLELELLLFVCWRILFYCHMCLVVLNLYLISL